MMNTKKEEDISKYVMDGIKNCTLRPTYIRKIGKVHARVDILGEVIKTVMQNHKETLNNVTMDEDGLLDIIITNKSNEEYAIPAKLFFERYDKDPNEEDAYIPKGIPIFAVQAFENISFKARWGTFTKLKGNEFIAIRSTNDIYPIQEEFFKESYEFVNPENINLQKFTCSDNYFSFSKTL